MNDASQLATAMIAVAFAAVLLVTGQLFIQQQSSHELAPLARTASTSTP